ncbi:Cof-type HAD-IIB family hydrolase [Anaerosinus massiliensis]|uniref:Cof-type HAD-IIB family hydrolase n=1 Tax=Massilibacillus massiliensis TaxID=1806837 RepID=UPI000ABE5591|nr:Cof-type HAD-IIB family hydrolase [Massilibacillus massiliensis]
MTVKLFVTDLDGTLLNKNHEVSEENKTAIREIAAKGITVTIATGRMYASTLPYAKQLGVDAPIITYNGALIKTVSGEVLFERYLDPAVVAEIYDYCKEQGWYIQSYADDVLYFREHDEKAKSYEFLAGLKGVALGDKLYEVIDKVPKMLIITKDGAESDAVVASLRERFKNSIFATKSNPEYVEIVNPNVNKAVALDILMKKLHLTKEEVMAIGDSDNDLPILKTAGFSIAMGNARDHVKAIVSAVTTDCEHSGVAAAIHQYILNK